jgi:glutathione synthase/RimK-type ligase-like ATP-grasp enzyme
VILLCGIPSQETQQALMHALDERDTPYRFLNQRGALSSVIRLEHDGSRSSPAGVLEHDGWSIALEEVSGLYVRFMDDRLLPELAREPPGSPVRAACRAFHDLVHQWAELADARVLNRSSAMASNFSKPYQLQLILEHGFAVPETLVTNDPELVRAFLAEHGRVIYKSISYERSIVRELDAADLERLEAIRWCPVQFQAYVAGTDVRVHTIGKKLFATAITTAATDYRYAHEQTGEEASFVAAELPQELAARCLALARGLGLGLAGIDLRITPDGRAVCFEVNANPGFAYYESYTGQPMTAAVAAHLAGED